MAKFIITFLIFILIGCEMKSNQIIKPEKYTFDIINFDTVSKTLVNEYISNSSDHEIMSDLIQYWFDNRIKTNGLEGYLFLNVKKIEFNREKREDYYKFSVSLSLDFVEEKSSNSSKTYNLKSNEYGEIMGNFAINDQDNLDLNIMYQSLKIISLKLKEVI
jgi:hypothetical protein